MKGGSKAKSRTLTTREFEKEREREGERDDSRHDLLQKSPLGHGIDLVRRESVGEERTFQPRSGVTLSKDEFSKGVDEGIEFAAGGIAADVDDERLGEAGAEMVDDVVDDGLHGLGFVVQGEEGGLREEKNSESGEHG